MAYQKFSVETFKKALKDNRYADSTGARRALGRAALSDADKEVCAKAITRFFGGPAVKKTAKPARSPKAKTARKNGGKKQS